jgi:hypothetical protein
LKTQNKNNMEILVFKTNLRFNKDLSKINPLINDEKRIKKWNVDRSDIDKVLRIESNNLMPEEVIQLIETAGYRCEELTD